jgi:hypothetical protein
MNNLAKQLAGQALDKAVSYTWTTLNYEQIHELLACHAELIVKECANIADKTQLVDRKLAVSFAIKEQFGVK